MYSHGQGSTTTTDAVTSPSAAPWAQQVYLPDDVVEPGSTPQIVVAVNSTATPESLGQDSTEALDGLASAIGASAAWTAPMPDERGELVLVQIADARTLFYGVGVDRPSLEAFVVAYFAAPR